MSEIGRFIIKHYLDIPTILRISRSLDEPRGKRQIAEAEGMGQPKARGLLEWGRHLGVIKLQEDRNYLITPFGKSIDKLRNRYPYEILYWKLVMPRSPTASSLAAVGSSAIPLMNCLRRRRNEHRRSPDPLPGWRTT